MNEETEPREDGVLAADRQPQPGSNSCAGNLWALLSLVPAVGLPCITGICRKFSIILDPGVGLIRHELLQTVLICLWKWTGLHEQARWVASGRAGGIRLRPRSSFSSALSSV